MTELLKPGDDVDLTNCDREPIHILGAIQPDGVLVGVSEPDWTVRVVSASVEPLLGLRPKDALGRAVELVLGRDIGGFVRDQSQQSGEDGTESTRFDAGPGSGSMRLGPVDVVVHRSDGLLVVEIEPAGEDPVLSPVSYRTARTSVRRLAQTSGIDGFADVLAREVHGLTGFDRVMVYRFDRDWNGEVIAEVRAPWLHPLLGQHYPASDIPVQARRLYTVNWLRLIADVNAERSPLLPETLPELGRPLDLSFAMLRSVSPIHIEYLQNMGVSASMSVSLVTGGVLWGMVTCHHYSGPRRPSFDARSAAEFVGQSASLLIDDREHADDQVFRDAANAAARALNDALAGDSRDPLQVLADQPEALLALTAAHGVVVDDGQRMHLIGATPDEATCRKLAGIGLGPGDTEQGVGGLYATDRLGTLAPELGGALAESGTAGLLRVSLGGRRRIMWLRPEVSRIIEWGGDPYDKQLAPEIDGEVRLSPRLSFEKWREVVRGTAHPWHGWDVDAAQNLGATVSATALRQAREQLVIVQDLHDSLVSEAPPVTAGLKIATAYRPAHGGQLGGDWWDVVLVDATRTALVLGDVAGHGIPAAATMMQMRTALQAYLLDGADPGQTLHRLDRLMTRLFPEDLVTVAIAVVDGTTGTLDVARAGHPPPLLLQDGRASHLDVPAHPPLGFGSDAPPHVFRTTLAPGAVLALYSDGLIERRGSSLSDGADHLVAAAVARPGEDLAAWTELLMGAVPGDAPDDTTLLTVRRDPA